MASGHNCEETRKYSKEFDAYYCESCNKWLEDTCIDVDCVYCNNRPLTPEEKND